MEIGGLIIGVLYFFLMMKVILPVLLWLSLFSCSCESSGFNQTEGWCYVKDPTMFDGYVPYDMRTESCVLCGEQYTVMPRDDMAKKKCCPDGEIKQKCDEREYACTDGGFYAAGTECDGKKDCVDGSDEKACGITCKEDMFHCGNLTSTEHQCIYEGGVCDGAKDCYNGMDEANCTFHHGRCDGFLCTIYRQCVTVDSVCNGTKECLDGTDETMCESLKRQEFECEKNLSTTPITMVEVCNQVHDCEDQEDEKNCFTWGEWSHWSPCLCLGDAEKVEVVRRERKCETLHVTVATTGQCEGVGLEARNITCHCASNVSSDLLLKIILPLMAILAVVALFFALQMFLRRKRAWSSYSQATVSFAHHSISSDGAMPDHFGGDIGPVTLSGMFEEKHQPGVTIQQNGQTLHSPHIYSSMEFKGHLSIHEDDEEDLISPGLLLPKDPYRERVPNPLYHAYSDSKLEYTVLDGNVLVRSPLGSPRLGRGERQMSQDEGSESTLMEQIEIAQMGNLIEISDMKLNYN